GGGDQIWNRPAGRSGLVRTRGGTTCRSIRAGPNQGGTTCRSIRAGPNQGGTTCRSIRAGPNQGGNDLQVVSGGTGAPVASLIVGGVTLCRPHCPRERIISCLREFEEPFVATVV